MPLDPMSVFNSIVGQKQLGAAAPAFQAGTSGFQPGGLLGPDQGQPDDFLQQLMQSQAPTSIEQLLAQQPQNTPPQPPQVQANDVAGLPSLQGMAQEQGQAVGQPQTAPETPPGIFGGLGEKLGAFSGNLDQNLQSPSKVLGLGLLSSIDPRLAQGGLLAGGLFGKNKVF